MRENYNTERDIGTDNRSDTGSRNETKPDYGGELASDVGVNLNKVSAGQLDKFDFNAAMNTGIDTGAKALDIGTKVAGAAISVGTKILETGIKVAGTALEVGLKAGTAAKVKSDDSSIMSKQADVSADSQQLDIVLDNFKENNWSDLSLNEQKQSITDLADYVIADTELENPPEIVFRNDMPDGSYGGYNPDTNTIEINENMLYDNVEAADTIAHEMWHAYQQQEATKIPPSEKGREYQEGFDNYISPEYDFEGYENQMVEAEAREYAQGFKDRLKNAA